MLNVTAKSAALNSALQDHKLSNVSSPKHKECSPAVNAGRAGSGRSAATDKPLLGIGGLNCLLLLLVGQPLIEVFQLGILQAGTP